MSQQMEKYQEKTAEHVQDRAWVVPRVDIYENIVY